MTAQHIDSRVSLQMESDVFLCLVETVEEMLFDISALRKEMAGQLPYFTTLYGFQFTQPPQLADFYL